MKAQEGGGLLLELVWGRGGGAGGICGPREGRMGSGCGEMGTRWNAKPGPGDSVSSRKAGRWRQRVKQEAGQGEGPREEGQRLRTAGSSFKETSACSQVEGWPATVISHNG